MKKILTGLIAITAISFSATAQEAVNASRANTSVERKQRDNRLNQKLLDQLGLTVTQKEQIKAVNMDYRTSMQELIKSEVEPESRKAKRTQLEAERTENIMKVLTAEQVQKLKTLRNNAVNEGKTGDGKYKSADGKTKIKTDGDETKIKVKTD